MEKVFINFTYHNPAIDFLNCRGRNQDETTNIKYTLKAIQNLLIHNAGIIEDFLETADKISNIALVNDQIQVTIEEDALALLDKDIFVTQEQDIAPTTEETETNQERYNRIHNMIRTDSESDSDTNDYASDVEDMISDPNSMDSLFYKFRALVGVGDSDSHSDSDSD